MSDLYEKYVLQNKDELAWFIDILKRENVRSYLEIGSMYGGSLWRIARSLPVGSRIVAVDLPQGTPKWERSKASLEAGQAALNALGYDCKVIWGDSTEYVTVKKVMGLGLFDACLIDGGHSLACVKDDWKNYGPLARIVAFHDISWVGPRPGKANCDVPQFWNFIKSQFRHEEIKLEPKDLGIGVLWQH